MTSATDTILVGPNSFGARLSNSSTTMALRLKQSMQGTERNKKIIRSTSKGKQQMMTFQKFLRQRRRKKIKGAEESGHDSLDPDDMIRVDDWRVSLRWRSRERARLVHQLEAK